MSEFSLVVNLAWGGLVTNGAILSTQLIFNSSLYLAIISVYLSTLEFYPRWVTQLLDKKITLSS